MSINIQTAGVHHISLRSADLERSKRFYIDTLGFSLLMEFPNLYLFQAGGSVFGVQGPGAETPNGDSFNPFRIGLDHLALACADIAELERVAAELTAAGIENGGVEFDETLGKKYISFKDPDRIAWEFYMA